MKSPLKHAPQQIALDGPSASGKTTVGTMLADRLGFGFLDTGMMYRAVTLIALRKSTPIDDVYEVGHIAETATFEVDRRADSDWRLIVDDEDLTEGLHSERVNRYVSPVSAISDVRRALVRHQREIADRGPIVMVGRDIGTVVLADAPLKIYLDAKPGTRANRRTSDIRGNTDRRRYEEILLSIKKRDEIDSNRADSPLRPAEDAVIINTDDLDAVEVVNQILGLIGIGGSTQHRPTEVGANAS